MNAFVRAGLSGGAALALAVACGSKHTAGGVVVMMSLDATLKVSDLSELRVEVDPGSDAGSSYLKRAYAIPADATFPTTFAIQSNGLSTASAALHLSVWGQATPATPIDQRDYLLVNVPVDSVTQFDVVFSRQCSPDLTACGPARTCCPLPAGTGGCSADVVGGAQPQIICQSFADSGASDATFDAEAGNKAGLDAGADADSTLNTEGSDASLDGENDDAPPVGYDGGPPCTQDCVEGQTHCVGGVCVPVPPSCAGGGLGAGLNCGGAYGRMDCCATLDVPLAARRFRKFVSAVTGEDGGIPWEPAPKSGKHSYLSGGGLNAGGTASDVHETGWDPSWNFALPTTKVGWDARLTAACQFDGATDDHTWTPAVDASHEKLPIACIDWFTAYAFCIWDGGFLPSTNEWEFAAAGGRTQRAYAWGDSAPGQNWNQAIYNCLYGTPGGLTSYCVGTANIAAVGSAPMGQGLWGQLDLTGNLYEWTFDFYDGTYPTPCVDCANVSSGPQRILRGGGFDSNGDQLYNTVLALSLPSREIGDGGIRCARPPH
jgi:hypothetical protein